MGVSFLLANMPGRNDSALPQGEARCSMARIGKRFSTADYVLNVSSFAAESRVRILTDFGACGYNWLRVMMLMFSAANKSSIVEQRIQHGGDCMSSQPSLS